MNFYWTKRFRIHKTRGSFELSSNNHIFWFAEIIYFRSNIAKLCTSHRKYNVKSFTFHLQIRIFDTKFYINRKNNFLFIFDNKFISCTFLPQHIFLLLTYYTFANPIRKHWLIQQIGFYKFITPFFEIYYNFYMMSDFKNERLKCQHIIDILIHLCKMTKAESYLSLF